MAQSATVQIGNTIRSLRLATGASQQDVAQRVGVSPALLSLWENGRRDPTIAGLRQLASVLSVPAPLLFAIALSSPEDESTAEQRALLDKLIAAARSRLLADQLLPLLAEAEDPASSTMVARQDAVDE